jgi:SAM-dependent methyltransferase
MFKKTNKLEQIFIKNNARLIYKWQHYFEIYDNHFKKFRHKKVKILEIGVGEGGSLQMWKKYFGCKAEIFGIDINEKCKQFEEKRITIIIGDQSDRQFLRDTAQKHGPFDLVIDDGSHIMEHQIITFEEMFPVINLNGIYLCEDLHTSYWSNFGGGYKDDKSFIEFSKNLIDYLNAWHTQDNELPTVSDFTRYANSMHYYDSILVIERRERKPPFDVKSGNPKIYKESLKHFLVAR